MRFKQHMKLEHGLKQIDIAPLIDVVFLLLIFFMLTSPFAVQSGINVKLPKAVTSDVIRTENVNITITSENVIYLNEKVATLKELREVLANPKMKNNLILIKADRRASVGRVVDVWDMCRNLGIEKLNIATNQDE